jgi:hypothetical protein
MTAHTAVSFFKSGMRGIGYGLLLTNLLAAAIVLVVAEIVEIIEECVI